MLQGLMVLQDITAVLALSIVPAFEVVSDPSEKGVDLAFEISVVLGVLVAVVVLLYFLSRYALPTIFKYFALDGEMLFIGTMGFAIGVAGLCALLSPNVAGLGAFFSGISIASLPYRLEIEKKCEPLRAFGVTLFFFMLGIDLNFTLESLGQAMPYSILISAVTLIVSPIIMWGLGYLSGIKARTAFFNGIIVNQISEFGLILGQTANRVGIFDESAYQIITVSMLITFLFSSIGHTQADRIFLFVQPYLAPSLDKHSTVSCGENEGSELQDHVVLLGFNETGLAVSEVYRKRGKEVFMIELNPALFECISTLRERVNFKRGMDEEKATKEKEMEDMKAMEEAVAVNQHLASRFEPLQEHAPTQLLAESTSASFWSSAKVERARDVEMRWRVNGKVQIDVEQAGVEEVTAQVGGKDFGEAEAGITVGGDDKVNGREGESKRSDGPGAGGGADGSTPPQEHGPILRKHKDRQSSLNTQWTADAASETVSAATQEAHEDCTGTALPATRRIASEDSGSRREDTGRWLESGASNKAFAASFASPWSLMDSHAASRDSARNANTKFPYPGTNIRAVYADPCAPETWHHYKLTRASLVVSCMPDGVSAEVRHSHVKGQSLLPHTSAI